MASSYTIEQLVTAIRAHMAHSGISQEELAREVGMHQSQVSRILRGEFRRLSPNLKKLCLYARIRVDSLGNGGQGRLASEELGKAVAEVWDGSKRHEKALIRVIRSLKAFGPPTALG